MKGYHGKLLEIDLTNGNTTFREITDEYLKHFTGGASLAAILLYSRLDKDLDPFSSNAPIIFCTGPLTGFSPFSGRHVVAGKSPLTELWGETTMGGFFGVELKRFGIDALIITGKAPKPVYLSLKNGTIEIKDATHLWGKSTTETTFSIKNEIGKGTRVICIGPAGEKLVRFASIMDEGHRAAGRTGMGAVMGAKNLKGVAISGDKGLPEVADQRRLKELYSATLEKISANPGRELWHTYGTLMYTTQGYEIGDTPAKYFQEGVFPAFKISGESMLEKYDVKNEGCALCPVICGHRVRGVKMEYESVGALGSTCMIFDLDALLDATQVCNEMGLDTISAGVTVAFAMYLSEKGILKDKIQWGDGKACVSLLEKIALREEIGDLFAEGTMRAAMKLGIPSDEAANVKGLEVPMHDPRAFSMQAISYATSVRGACHMRSDYFTVDIAAAPIPELGITPSDRFEESEQKVKMMVVHQNVKEMWNAALICMLGIFDINDYCGFHTVVTGIETKPADISLYGERSYILKRLLNLKLGMTKDQERLPKVVTTPLKRGGTGGFSPNLEKTLQLYYKIRKIGDNGYPLKEKIEELGIDQFI
ncbi:MAG: aldehyde ferredoxin oxidoreductase family protein [Deltaproteobacteria bacterium]|nr:aldehyde ferredoxin oxidoreductase family protein [Deltaproteobacteria bacterium]